jgi:hypothetical protein
VYALVFTSCNVHVAAHTLWMDMLVALSSFLHAYSRVQSNKVQHKWNVLMLVSADGCWLFSLPRCTLSTLIYLITRNICLAGKANYGKNSKEEKMALTENHAISWKGNKFLDTYHYIELHLVTRAQTKVFLCAIKSVMAHKSSINPITRVISSCSHIKHK